MNGLVLLEVWFTSGDSEVDHSLCALFKHSLLSTYKENSTVDGFLDKQCDYHSILGKCSWALKDNTRFWPAWALMWAINYCTEAATLILTPRNLVHGCLPGSRYLN